MGAGGRGGRARYDVWILGGEGWGGMGGMGGKDLRQNGGLLFGWWLMFGWDGGTY